jgi:hypothetical protein
MHDHHPVDMQRAVQRQQIADRRIARRVEALA